MFGLTINYRNLKRPTKLSLYVLKFYKLFIRGDYARHCDKPLQYILDVIDKKISARRFYKELDSHVLLRQFGITLNMFINRWGVSKVKSPRYEYYAEYLMWLEYCERRDYQLAPKNLDIKYVLDELWESLLVKYNFKDRKSI